MLSFRSGTRKIFPASLSLFLVPFVMMGLLWGCSDTVNPTLSEESPPLEEQGTPPNLSTLQQAAQEAPVRLEVELEFSAGAWFADEVEVETETDLGNKERIETQVTASNRSTRTLSLRIGDLQVEISPGATYALEDGEPVSQEMFFDALEVELAGGSAPGVELSRAPVSPPQAPEEMMFVAQEVRLDADSDDHVLDLNVDGRHLLVQSQEVGTLTLLGTEIGVDLQNGSLLEERTSEESGAVDVEGLAAAVDEAAGAVELTDGTVIRIVEGTRIKDGDDDDGLGSLAEVATALAEDLVVEVDAEAVLETEGVYIAVEIEFEVDENDGEFEGRVKGADREAGTFTLMNDRSYVVPGPDVFTEDSELTSLEAMAGALEAGVVVTVEGEAELDPETGERVVTEVTVETNADDDDGEFEGRVKGADVEAGTFTLMNDRSYVVPGPDVFTEDSELASLEAMAGALEAGLVVTVEGEAELDPETGERVVTEVTVKTPGG